MSIAFEVLQQAMLEEARLKTASEQTNEVAERTWRQYQTAIKHRMEAQAKAAHAVTDLEYAKRAAC